MGLFQSVQTGSASSGAVSADSVVKPTGRGGDIVIIPVDRSKQAETAFEWYCRHVHRPENRVRIIHCQEIEHPSGATYPDYAIPPEQFAELMEKARKSGSELVSKYEKRMKELEVQGSVHSEVGKPGEAVITAIDTYKGTHVVMGSRGFGVIRRTILGSVSEYVIHHTKVPVTVIPRETTSWFF